MRGTERMLEAWTEFCWGVIVAILIVICLGIGGRLTYPF